jgi:hypothetical protein
MLDKKGKHLMLDKKGKHHKIVWKMGSLSVKCGG